MDPKEHYKLGESLSGFRNDGVCIITSGQITHNLRAMMGNNSTLNKELHAGNLAFTEWFKTIINSTAMTKEDKKEALVNWLTAPGARDAHPREEHFMTFIVAMGAANGNVPETTLDTWAPGIDCMAFINLLWE